MGGYRSLFAPTASINKQEYLVAPKARNGCSMCVISSLGIGIVMLLVEMQVEFRPSTY